MNMLDTFTSFILALMVKDFYDLFVKEHIRTVLSNYKISIKKTVTKNVKNRKNEK